MYILHLEEATFSSFFDKAIIKRSSKLKFRVAVSTATVLNRVLDFWCGHKLNRVGKITDFGNKYEKGFGKQAALLHRIFLGVPLGYYEVVHK